MHKLSETVSKRCRFFNKCGRLFQVTLFFRVLKILKSKNEATLALYFLTLKSQHYDKY